MEGRKKGEEKGRKGEMKVGWFQPEQFYNLHRTLMTTIYSIWRMLQSTYRKHYTILHCVYVPQPTY